MTTRHPSNTTPTGEVPSEVPGEVPAGTSVVHRAGEVPGSLSFGGTSLARPLSTDPTHEVPSEVPTPICGHTRTGPTGITWTCITTHPHTDHYYRARAAA